MYYVLFNSLSGNGQGAIRCKMLEKCFPGEVEYVDMHKVESYQELFNTFSKGDIPVLVGGDGTMNRFLNDTEGVEIPEPIYYFPAGSGNDFMNDVKETATYVSDFRDENGYGVIDLTPYIKNLPIVTVNDKNYRFINGIGYGIDGYCCEVGDELRKKTDKPINYTSIAIKGLLFYYKPTNAKITVDGVTKEYKHVWLAPAMNGRFYGGGMMACPGQDRLSESRTLSSLVFHSSGKLRTLTIFPSIFKGAHVKHTKFCELLHGKDITVEFDSPTALQIDGETILGVTKYRAYYPD